MFGVQIDMGHFWQEGEWVDDNFGEGDFSGIGTNKDTSRFQMYPKVLVSLHCSYHTEVKSHSDYHTQICLGLLPFCSP